MRPDPAHLPTPAAMAEALLQEMNERVVPLPTPQERAELARLVRQRRLRLPLSAAVRRGRRLS